MHANALFARDCLDNSLTANDKTRSMYDDKTINFEFIDNKDFQILLFYKIK